MNAPQPRESPAFRRGEEVNSVLRLRGSAKLQRVRYISEAVQRGLLRPLPERIGRLHIASVYLAADNEARIGGDLYAATRTPSGSTRLIAVRQLPGP